MAIAARASVIVLMAFMIVTATTVLDVGHGGTCDFRSNTTRLVALDAAEMQPASDIAKQQCGQSKAGGKGGHGFHGSIPNDNDHRKEGRMTRCGFSSVRPKTIKVFAALLQPVNRSCSPKPVIYPNFIRGKAALNRGKAAAVKLSAVNEHCDLGKILALDEPFQPGHCTNQQSSLVGPLCTRYTSCSKPFNDFVGSAVLRRPAVRDDRLRSHAGLVARRQLRPRCSFPAGVGQRSDGR